MQRRRAPSFRRGLFYFLTHFTRTPPPESQNRVRASSSHWGQPLPGNRHDSRGWEESGAKATVGKTMTIADGGYQGTGLVVPHRRRKGEELPAWKEEHNRSHKQVRARVEHTFARMKSWKILRDCRLKKNGVHHAMLGIARLHNLNLAG